MRGAIREDRPYRDRNLHRKGLNGIRFATRDPYSLVFDSALAVVVAHGVAAIAQGKPALGFATVRLNPRLKFAILCRVNRELAVSPAG